MIMSLLLPPATEKADPLMIMGKWRSGQPHSHDHNHGGGAGGRSRHDHGSLVAEGCDAKPEAAPAAAAPSSRRAARKPTYHKFCMDKAGQSGRRTVRKL